MRCIDYSRYCEGVVLKIPDRRETHVFIGTSRLENVEDCAGALANLHLNNEELAEIYQYAIESNVNL